MSYVAVFAHRNVSYSREQIFSKQDTISKKTILFLTLLIILFSVLYILQANSVTTDGYKIRAYKNEIVALETTNRILALKLSEIQSLSFLENQIKDFNMVTAEHIEYLLSLPVAVK